VEPHAVNSGSSIDAVPQFVGFEQFSNSQVLDEAHASSSGLDAFFQPEEMQDGGSHSNNLQGMDEPKDSLFAENQSLSTPQLMQPPSYQYDQPAQQQQQQYGQSQETTLSQLPIDLQQAAPQSMSERTPGEHERERRKIQQDTILRQIEREGAQRIENTMVGRISSLMKRNGPMTLVECSCAMTGHYSELRKPDGTKYKGSLEKAVNGALYSTGVFVRDQMNGRWAISEAAIRDYEGRLRRKFEQSAKKRKGLPVNAVLSTSERPPEAKRARTQSTAEGVQGTRLAATGEADDAAVSVVAVDIPGTKRRFKLVQTIARVAESMQERLVQAEAKTERDEGAEVELKVLQGQVKTMLAPVVAEDELAKDQNTAHAEKVRRW
jgi:hypothetical protein